jgi:hypothetical protein
MDLNLKKNLNLNVVVANLVTGESLKRRNAS